MPRVPGSADFNQPVPLCEGQFWTSSIKHALPFLQGSPTVGLEGGRFAIRQQSDGDWL